MTWRLYIFNFSIDTSVIDYISTGEDSFVVSGGAVLFGSVVSREDANPICSRRSGQRAEKV